MEYRDTIQACRDTVRKAKVHLELNVARIVKDSNKCLSIGDKRKTKENIGILLNDKITQDTEKAEVLNTFYSSQSLLSRPVFRNPWSPISGRENWSKEYVPLVEDNQAREYLGKLDINKSTGPDGMYP